MDRIREAAAAHGASFGSWISSSDPAIIELVGKAGYDWVILDTQHGAIGWDGLLPALQALDLSGTRALVRVGWTDPAQIMRALDLGAVGVVVPMVSNGEQARIAARATRYPPHGERSFGPVRNYYAQPGSAAPEPLCFVMIETEEALQHLDEIAATPGIEGLFVGPVDMGLALGLGIKLQMPAEVFDACDQVIAACMRHGKIPGCATLGSANAEALMKRGMQFLTLGSDMGLIRRGAAADVAQIRAWTGRDN